MKKNRKNKVNKNEIPYYLNRREQLFERRCSYDGHLFMSAGEEICSECEKIWIYDNSLAD